MVSVTIGLVEVVFRKLCFCSDTLWHLRQQMCSDICADMDGLSSCVSQLFFAPVCFVLSKNKQGNES